MKDKIVLGIAVTCLASLASSLPVHATGSEPVATPAKTDASHGGKCASGKCGTEKIYSKAAVTNNPDDALVRARDGKCGLSGKGYAVTQSKQDRLANGVCGQ